MRHTAASALTAHARTLEAAVDAWLTHLAATGCKATSVRAYRTALNKWFLPTLKAPVAGPDHDERDRTRHPVHARRGTVRQVDP